MSWYKKLKAHLELQSSQAEDICTESVGTEDKTDFDNCVKENQSSETVESNKLKDTIDLSTK
jgi:hypothetical protein